MSNEKAKFLNSRRRHKTDVAIARQVRIAKQHNAFPDNHNLLKEKHRLSKHHVMDCGNPECVLCSNPRRIEKHGETKQEKSFLQTEKWND